MASPGQRKKPNRIRILLIPVVAPIFMFGWILAHTGESRNHKKQRPISKSKRLEEEVAFSAIPQDELTIKA